MKEKIKVRKNIYIQKRKKNWYDIFYNEGKIGHLSLWKECEIHDLRLDEKFRKKGIGTLIYNYAENHFFNNCDSINLIATLDAYPFWERMGFKKQPSGMKTSIFMKKDLQKIGGISKIKNRKFKVEGKMQEFKLADYGSLKRVEKEKNRLKKKGSWYIRKTKKADGTYELWIKEIKY